MPYLAVGLRGEGGARLMLELEPSRSGVMHYVGFALPKRNSVDGMSSTLAVSSVGCMLTKV